MSRPLRVDVEGGVYHVVTRGIDRKAIFRCDDDRRHCLNLMAEAHVRFRLRFFAYVLMDNHVHWVVQTPDANLSRAMQWLKVSYSMWFNAKYQRVGPLFQGRFKSVLVDQDESWLLKLSYYVHLNPVRTQMVGLNKRNKKLEALGLKQPSTAEAAARRRALRGFKWSSYRYYAGFVRAVPEWLDMHEILRRCSTSDPSAFYRRATERIIDGGHDQGFMEILSSRLCIGSAKFSDQVRSLSGQPVRDVTSKHELRMQVSWSRLLQVAEEVRGEAWDQFGNRRGDVGRAVVFRLARRYCVMSLKEVGAVAGGVDYAAVSDRIRRYEKCGKVADMEHKMVSILNLET